MDSGPVTPRRRAALGALLASAAAALGLALAGCGDTAGYTDSGNRAAGKELFVAACGSCHVLNDAGTKGQIGPNLDDAFRRAREDGMTEDTFRQVVRGQISYPVVTTPTGSPGMPGIDQTLPECTEPDVPRGCVEDQDQAADDIAAYVASVAGLEPIGEPGGSGGGAATSGEQVFASAGCASCHALAAAGASGTVGPNLDTAKPSAELVVDRVTNGQGAMPAFGDQLSAAQIKAVAEYVSSNAGK